MKKSKKLLKVNLACGNNLQKGFVGVDIIGKPETQAKIVHNLLTFPYPFKDNSVDEIFCSHFIEHLPHRDSFNDYFFDFFNELYRIMKPGAKATFVAPYYTSMRAIQDPTHHRSIGEATFLYVSKEWRKLNKLEHYPIKCDFKVESMNYSTNPAYEGRSQEAMQQMVQNYWNVVNDIAVVLRKQ